MLDAWPCATVESKIILKNQARVSFVFRKEALLVPVVSFEREVVCLFVSFKSFCPGSARYNSVAVVHSKIDSTFPVFSGFNFCEPCHPTDL